MQTNVSLYIAILMAETLLAHLQFTVTQSQQKFVYFYKKVPCWKSDIMWRSSEIKEISNF